MRDGRCPELLPRQPLGSPFPKRQNSSGAGQKKRVHFSRTPGLKTGENSRETDKNMFRDIRKQQAPDVIAPPSVAELAEQMKTM